MSHKNKTTIFKLLIALAWAIISTALAVIYLLPSAPAIAAVFCTFSSLATVHNFN